MLATALAACYIQHAHVLIACQQADAHYQGVLKVLVAPMIKLQQMSGRAIAIADLLLGVADGRMH